jgi:cell wall-associated NlpC family hydrolase
MVFAFAGIEVNVPHQTQAFWAAFQPAITDPAQAHPDDMLLSSNDRATGIHHVGLDLGDGHMLHAPETGETIKIADNIWSSSYWLSEFIGDVRSVLAPDPRT